MKRFIVLTCLLLACNLLFAEITTLYEKKENNRIVRLTKYEDVSVMVNPNLIELETLEPTDNKKTFISCGIYTTDLSREKDMKKITAKLATVKNYYEIIKDLDLQLVNDDVFFEDDLIYYVYEFVLE
jgi:hypothetical protein